MESKGRGSNPRRGVSSSLLLLLLMSLLHRFQIAPRQVSWFWRWCRMAFPPSGDGNSCSSKVLGHTTQKLLADFIVPKATQTGALGRLEKVCFVAT